MSNRNSTRILLVLCVLALAYLSLYPFTFTRTAKASGMAWQGPKLDSDWVDMFANFLFYLPLGFLATAARRRRNTASVLASTLLGATLSLAMELAQMYLPQRDSNLRDLVFNAAGTLAGSLGAVAVRRLRTTFTISWPSPVACALILLWAGWQMFPFFPLLKRYKLHELAAQLSVWNFSVMEFGDIGLAAFLLYAFIAQPGQTGGVTARIAAAVLALVLLGQSLIAGLTYSNTRVVAAAAGLIAAALFWRPQRQAWWIALAAVLCGWAVFRELDPFRMQDPLSGNPVQIAGSLSRSPYIRDLAGKTFLYCALAASLYRGLFARAKETLPSAPGGVNARR